MATVALVTCAQLPQLDPDEQLLAAALTERGITAVPAVWDDPTIDWDSFDLSVVRCTWDYQDRRDSFLRWARSVPRLENPAAVIEWNTDKRYLGDLAAAGIPTVPTTWLFPGPRKPLPESGMWVLKPTIGAGSRNAGRYRLDDPAQRELARAHRDRLNESGATVMAQPYIDSVDSQGEKALIYVDGTFSHAVVKSAMLDGPSDPDITLFKDETITAAHATEPELSLAETALKMIPAPLPLYARVDVLATESGPVVLEVELSEPSLFFGYTAHGATRMAAAIAARMDG